MSSSDGLGGAAARCLGEPLILTGALFSFGTAGLCLCWACRSSFIPGAMSPAAWLLASCVQAGEVRGVRGGGCGATWRVGAPTNFSGSGEGEARHRRVGDLGH